MSCLKFTELNALNKDQREKHLGSVDDLRAYSDRTNSSSMQRHTLAAPPPITTAITAPCPQSPNENLSHHAITCRIIREGVGNAENNKPVALPTSAPLTAPPPTAKEASIAVTADTTSTLTAALTSISLTIQPKRFHQHSTWVKSSAYICPIRITHQVQLPSLPYQFSSDHRTHYNC